MRHLPNDDSFADQSRATHPESELVAHMLLAERCHDLSQTRASRSVDRKVLRMITRHVGGEGVSTLVVVTRYMPRRMRCTAVDVV